MQKNIQTIIKNMERLLPDIRTYHILDKKKLAAEKTAFVVQAHADDNALAEGLDHILAKAGFCVVNFTLTDGSARFGEFDAALAEHRIHEDNKAAGILGAGMVVNAGYRDGLLHESESAATKVLEKTIDIFKPSLVIAPHRGDPHIDHRSAFRIAKQAINGSAVTLYSMDTISRMTRSGEQIVPTYYFSLSHEEKTIRDNAYLAHESQTTNLPEEHEYKAVTDVLELPIKRGQEIGIPYAGIVVKESGDRDPIAEILGKKIFTLRS